MKLSERQINVLIKAADATDKRPVAVVGPRKGGTGPIDELNEVAEPTARSLVNRGLAEFDHRYEDFIGGYVCIEITDAGREILAELIRTEESAGETTNTNDHTAPETFMGVPVPRSLAHDWDHVHAIWWRYGVRAAVTDINDVSGSIVDLTSRLIDDTNPEEGIKA